MPKLLRAVLAVILGFVAGSAMNMGLITLGPLVIPPPPGADVTTMEGLKTSLQSFEPRHFVFPFMAHAVGTFVGAFVAAALAPGRSATPAYVVGVLFLLGGIANVLMLPAPAWFSALDLLLAYLPAAWLGNALAVRGFGRGASDA
jgi:TRAP-type mannitol/chloroaromatic compound transport system permease large subunit